MIPATSDERDAVRPLTEGEMSEDDAAAGIGAPVPALFPEPAARAAADARLARLLDDALARAARGPVAPVLDFGTAARDMARFDFAAHRGFGEKRDSGVDFDRPLDRFDIVELHHHPHLNVVQVEHAIDLTADRQVVIEADHRLTVQLLQTDGRFFGERVRWGAHQSHRLFPPGQGLDGAR